MPQRKSSIEDDTVKAILVLTHSLPEPMPVPCELFLEYNSFVDNSKYITSQNDCLTNGVPENIGKAIMVNNDW